jgi:hypothetical protein
MLQRIQSVYLLLVVILSGVAFYSPVATLLAKNATYIVSYKGVYQIDAVEGHIFQSPAWGISVFALLIPITALVTFFLFKNRKLQAGLGYLNIGFIAMYYASVFAYTCAAAGRYAAEWTLHYNIILPVICAILTFMAVSAIKKDEALVKSHERLR